MFWKDVGMKTPDSAMCCSIVHDNHNAWVVGSSDAAMATAVNAMAAMDGGFVLVPPARSCPRCGWRLAG